MILLDETLATPEENLALEEALLEWGETNGLECLRFWESASYFVVMGAGSPSKTDVNREGCLLRGIPVLRRCSGGGTVLQGPGCLNFTLVLDRGRRPELESITSTNETVLTTVAKGLEACGLGAITMKGYSDLTVDEWKFSGNAQRRRRQYVLFHGTILYNMNLDLISEVLGTPDKMPEYREAREHAGFVRNVPVDPQCARREIAKAWDAAEPMTAELREALMDRVAQLSGPDGRYRDSKWIWGI